VGNLDRSPSGRVVLPTAACSEWGDHIGPHLVDAMTHAGAPTPAEIVDRLSGLWEVLDELVERAGTGRLQPWGVRWAGAWQLVATSAAGPGVAAPVWASARAAGWRSDLHTVLAVLVRALAGRWPISEQDAMRLVRICAGELPLGIDSICAELCDPTGAPGTTADLRELTDLLAVRCGAVGARAYVETAVGSRKAAGRPGGDNEDAAGWTLTTAGDLNLAVLDGVTGPGDGSGRRAARVALAAAAAMWHQHADVPPETVLSAAHAAVVTEAAPAAAVAIFGRVSPDGAASLAGVGDASAWLLRRRGDSSYVSVRLTPEQTSQARLYRADPLAWSEDSVVECTLGGDIVGAFRVGFAVVPGDLIVVVTDGAAVDEIGREDFPAALVRLARERVAAGAPMGPSLAAAITGRAESLGGWDNATALVVDVARLATATGTDPDLGG